MAVPSSSFQRRSLSLGVALLLRVRGDRARGLVCPEQGLLHRVASPAPRLPTLLCVFNFGDGGLTELFRVAWNSLHSAASS